MTTDKFIWWEKTVEYSFVLKMIGGPKKLNFASPLAGVQEGAGDAIFGNSGGNLVLVEFKKSRREIVSEFGKFHCYSNALKDLRERDGHHFLIYGEVDFRSKNENPDLLLTIRSYFSCKSCDDILSCGVNSRVFNEYLKDLLNHKKIDKRSTGSSVINIMASVIGISADGSMCAIISLSEYCDKYFPDYTYEPRETEKIGPSDVARPRG